LNYELIPKFEVNVVTISTIYPGASPSEIESTVTKKIEDGVSALENIKKIQSYSYESLSVVVVQLTNDANVDNTLDMSSTAVIQYAVEHLNVKHIVVCGHYDCGGVKAAMQAKDYGLLNPWLRTIRDVYRLHQEELDAITDADKRYRRFVEINVIEQCFNVTKMAIVQESYLQYRTPLVHGWVFDIHSGELIDLNIDFEDFIHKIQRIYDLTGEDWYKHY